MKCFHRASIALCASFTLLAPPGLEAATLLQDTFSRGSVGSAVDLAGSSPDAGSQWSALYQYRLSPLRQVAVTGTAETNGTIANFGNRDLGDLDTTTLFNPAASGAMTLSATLGSSGAAEWSFVGFSTTANSQNDPFNGIGPFILVRPGKFNGDVAEFFTGPIGPSGEASFTSFPISGDTHTASITYDPDTQTVSASLDGMPFGGGATPFRYTYGGANPAAPVINGLAMGLRGDSMGDENPTSAIVSANNPAFGTFDDVLVTQVPEPAAIVLLAIGGVSVLLFFRNGRNGLPIA